MAIDNYYISGVWFDNQKVITHVYLHLITTNGWNKGVKTEVKEVIKLIDNGSVVKTLVWSYLTADWIIGAKVLVVNERGSRYLRTKADKTIRDNLDNLIRMHAIA